MKREDKERKLKKAKQVWLTLFIILLINNVVADTVIAFGQTPPPGPNPFTQYLPELADLGYLLAGVLFMLGLLAYRKDYSYAILLISAAALLAALLNYSIASQAGYNGTVLKVVPVQVEIFVTYNGQTVASYPGSSEGSFQAKYNQYFYVSIYTYPPAPITNVTWLEGTTDVSGLLYSALGKTSYTGQYITSPYFMGTNTIIVEVDYVKDNTLYYGTGYVSFRYIPESGSIFQEMLQALSVDSGIGVFALGGIPGILEYLLYNGVANAINNLIESPVIGNNGAGADAQNFFNYFQNIAISIGFILLALGIGINAIRGGYADLVDLGMDFFYRTGVFLLFTYGGIQIYNAVASSLNSIAQYIVNDVLGQIAGALTVWTNIAIAMTVGSNFIGFGFGRALSQLAVFLFEVDIAIFAISYLRVVIIYALVSLIPILAAMWTFEWTRGVALVFVEVLAGLVFGGLVDALVLYFLVQVGGLSFFLFAPFAVFAMILVGWGAHQAVKSAGLSIAGRGASSLQHVGSTNQNQQSQQNRQPQNVPVTQVLPPQNNQNQGQNPQQTQQVPVTQVQQTQRLQQLNQPTRSIQQLAQPTVSINTANQQTQSLSNNNNNAYSNSTYIDPELIGAFFKSLEATNVNSENVKTYIM